MRERSEEEGGTDELRAFVRAYQEPAARRHLLQLASRLTGIGYWIYNIPDDVIHWSSEIYEIAGVDRETFHLDLRSALQAYHPEDRKLVIGAAVEASETGEDFEYEVRVVRPSGETRHVACVGTCDTDDDGEVLMLFAAFQDITERKALHGRIMRTQHLASIGSVATGIAHGVNNPLTSLFVNLELALEELDHLDDEDFDPDFLADTLRQARDGAERVRRVVGGLKAFAREERARAQPLDFRNVVEVALTLTQNELRHCAKLETSYRPAPSVHAVSSRLEQVAVGLMLHAGQCVSRIDAVEAVVRLNIDTDSAGNALFEVMHNGTSPPPSELDQKLQTFEPESDSVGGLGLAVCRAIVYEDGGTMEVTQRDGWTTFGLRFPPASTRPVNEELERAFEKKRASAIAARVLVVDDEEIVGNSVARILPDDEVVVANSGARALEVLEEYGDEHFDIILCDMMMPGMSGQELFNEISETSPRLAERFVFVTGGVFNENASQFLARRPERWVAKPYDVGKIRSLVAESALRRSGEAQD